MQKKTKDKECYTNARAAFGQSKAGRVDENWLCVGLIVLIVELDLDGRLHRSLVVLRLVRQAVHSVRLSLDTRAELHQLLCNTHNKEKEQSQKHSKLARVIDRSSRSVEENDPDALHCQKCLQI